MQENKKVFLTPDGLKKLEEEKQRLVEKRPEISERIQNAKEYGDLSENAEYESARKEQAFVEGKIADLTWTINNAVIIDKEKNKECKCVGLGTQVTVLDEDKQKHHYQIVGSAEADPFEGKISNDSPVGQALMGATLGEKVKANTPQGERSLEIIMLE